MELRYHPLMHYHRVPSWPPVWTLTRSQSERTVRGEVGVLTHVTGNHQVTNRCYLVIEHENERYMGCLIVDDIAFCSEVSAILQNQLGHSIKEIGDLDLSSTL